MHGVRRLIVGFLGLIAGLSLTGASFAENYKDWEIGCDNGHHCLAVGFPAKLAGASYLLFERDAGSSAQPVVTLVAFRERHQPRLGEIRLAVDDKPIPRLGTLKGPTEDRDVWRFTLSGPDTPDILAALLASLRTGQTLNILPIDGGPSDQVSLSGAVAALLHMDDVQGRIGTETALIRRGAKPAASVPSAPALPVVTAAIPKPDLVPPPDLAQHLRAALQGHQERSTCADVEDPRATGEDRADPLTTNLTLVQIACSLGAYQGETEFFLVRGQDVAHARRVLFHYPLATVRDEESLVGAEFDPATASIGFGFRARGFGDCGNGGQFVWTGSEFVLSRYSELDTCNGDIQDWPTLWRSEIRPGLGKN